MTAINAAGGSKSDAALAFQPNNTAYRVALLVNLASNAPPPLPDAPHDALAELDSDNTAAAYEKALMDAGHAVAVCEGGPHLPPWLR